jgi:O-antigen/teichoic acid export membrane protein
MGAFDNSKPASQADSAASAAVVATDSRSSTRRSPSVAQAILLGSAFGQLGLALVVTIFLARVLTPGEFGFFSLVGTIFILARKFLDLGLSNVAARDIAHDATRERPILEGMMAYRRVAGLALALSMFVFAFAQRSGAERWVLIAAGVVLLFTEPAALDPVFQVRQAQGGPALVNLIGGVLVLVGSVIFRRFAVAGMLFASLLVVREAFSLVSTKLLADRLLGYHPRPGFRGRNLRAFVGPALIFGLASLIYTVYFNCDVFFVLALRGHDELGAYAAAFRPINPLLLLPWMLMVPIVPVLTATLARDREHYVRQVRSACGIAIGLGACGLVGGTVLAPDLVQLLYRGRYLDGALSCVNAFRWLAVALGLVCVTTVLTASMLADKREKMLLTIGTVALIANVGLNVVLLQHYNFTAAGFATAATELLYLVGALVAFCAVTKRVPIGRNAFAYLLPPIMMAAILHVLPGAPAVRVSCGVILGSLCVATILLSSAARQFRQDISVHAPRFAEPVPQVEA